VAGSKNINKNVNYNLKKQERVFLPNRHWDLTKMIIASRRKARV
jgi:hypothetical protein